MTNSYSERVKANKLVKGILPPLIGELRASIENLRFQPLPDFRDSVTKLMHRGLSEFLSFLGLEDPNMFSLKDYALFMKSAISAFNSVIPQDHPYIIALIVIRGINRSRVSFVYRRMITGIQKVSPGDVLPVIVVETEEDFERIIAGQTKMEINCDN